MAATIIVKFIHGIILNERKSDKKGILTTDGLKELAKVAIIVTRPAWPKTIRIEAIRRLWGTAVISSASFVVNPVAVKHDKA
jgi:predicted metallopeptidase